MMMLMITRMMQHENKFKMGNFSQKSNRQGQPQFVAIKAELPNQILSRVNSEISWW